MKYFFAIVLAALCAGSAVAQISINSSHAPQNGLVISNNSTIDDVSWSPGSGSNQTWNITSYDYTADATIEYISPVGTPYASSFPTATQCVTSGGFSWTYYRIENSGMYLQGFATLVDTFEFIQIPDDEILLIPFPCNMGTNWTTVMRITMEPAPGFVSMTVDSTINTVDGWGTLTTPEWTESALRMYSHGFTSIYLNGMPIGQTTEDWSYSWLTQNASHGAGYSSATATGPNFTTGDVYYTTTGTIDADPVRGPIAVNFKLSQNYPNPFNPSTTLPIELAKSSTVELTIYNEVGQVVQQMSYELGAGQHDLSINGSAWSTGSYFAKVMAGNEVQTTRMVLAK